MAEYCSPRKDGGGSVTSERTSLLLTKRQDLIEEDVYIDYHEASVASGLFNLSTTVMGSEIMALPTTMKVLGLPLGILSIIIMGVLSENSIQTMLRYLRPSGARSYGGLMDDAFGILGRVLVQLCIIVNNINILIVYLIIISNVLLGTSGAGKHYTGVLEEWVGGATWWNERTFVLFTMIVVILLRLIAFRHVEEGRGANAGNSSAHDHEGQLGSTTHNSINGDQQLPARQVTPQPVEPTAGDSAARCGCTFRGSSASFVVGEESSRGTLPPLKRPKMGHVIHILKAEEFPFRNKYVTVCSRMQ